MSCSLRLGGFHRKCRTTNRSTIKSRMATTGRLQCKKIRNETGPLRRLVTLVVITPDEVLIRALPLFRAVLNTTVINSGRTLGGTRLVKLGETTLGLVRLMPIRHLPSNGITVVIRGTPGTRSERTLAINSNIKALRVTPRLTVMSRSFEVVSTTLALRSLLTSMKMSTKKTRAS